MKRTLRGSKLTKRRKLGFRARMKTKGGKTVLSRRRKKGRAKLASV